MRQLVAFVALCLAACGSSPGAGEDMSGTVTDDLSMPGGGNDDLAMPPPPDLLPFVGVSVLQHHNHATRDGVYLDATLTSTAAAKMHIDAAFDGKYSLATGGAGPAYAQPLFVDQGGAGDFVIVATESNYVLAFDAITGKLKWHTDPSVLGTAATSGFSCGNINPSGITGTPAIDLGTRAMFFQTDVAGSPPKHLIHSLSIDTGAERAGWPIDVEKVVTGFASAQQGSRGAVAIVGGMVFVPYGGRSGDCTPYRGYVIGLPLSNPTTASAVAWQTKASDASGGGAAGGIWSPEGIASDGTSVFFVTGNAWNTFPTDWYQSYTEGIFRLGPSLAFNTADTTSFYAPADWNALDHSDTDFSGSGVVLVDVPGATKPHLAVVLGKDSKMYVLDRTNLGGLGATALFSGVVAGSEIINAPSAYTTTMGTYVTFKATCPGGGSPTVNAVQITNALTAGTTWCANVTGGGSPVVTTTGGGKNTVVWWVSTEGEGITGDYKLYGFDGDTGNQIVATAAMGPSHRFISPIAAKGRIYVAADDQLYSFITP